MEVMGRKSAAATVVVVAVVVMVGLVGMSGAANVCGMDDEGLSACKPWVTQPCPADPPPAKCCECLSKADLACLCSYKDSFLLPSLGIDPALALELPAKCGLTNAPSC